MAKLADGVVTVTDTFALDRDGEVTFSLICDAEPKQMREDCFTLHGRTVSFDSSLRFSYEVIDCSEVETKPLPAEWGVPALYRILLASKTIPAGEKKQYRLLIR